MKNKKFHKIVKWNFNGIEWFCLFLMTLTYPFLCREVYYEEIKQKGKEELSGGKE